MIVLPEDEKWRSTMARKERVSPISFGAALILSADRSALPTSAIRFPREADFVAASPGMMRARDARW
jgi:hypothetical protein